MDELGFLPDYRIQTLSELVTLVQTQNEGVVASTAQ
jgi:hypothetical protein